MFRRDPVKARDKLVYARIVFHRAGAQWIHAEVDRVIPRGKPRKVANHLDLADFWKSFDAVAAMLRAKRFRSVYFRHVERR